VETKHEITRYRSPPKTLLITSAPSPSRQTSERHRVRFVSHHDEKSYRVTTRCASTEKIDIGTREDEIIAKQIT
jgi:hypothetical protein